MRTATGEEIILLDSHPKLLERFDANITEGNRPVVALQHDGTRLIHLLVQLSAGGFGDFHFVVNFNPIQNDRNFITANGRLRALPLAGGARNVFRSSGGVIDAAIAAGRWFLSG